MSLLFVVVIGCSSSNKSITDESTTDESITDDVVKFESCKFSKVISCVDLPVCDDEGKITFPVTNTMQYNVQDLTIKSDCQNGEISKDLLKAGDSAIISLNSCDVKNGKSFDTKIIVSYKTHVSASEHNINGSIAFECDSAKALPNKCLFQRELDCVEFDIVESTNDVKFIGKLENNMGADIVILNVSCSSMKGDSGKSSFEPKTVAKGEKYSIACNQEKGNKWAYFVITWYDAKSSPAYAHKTGGQIYYNYK
jgi:hypothetical protein